MVATAKIVLPIVAFAVLLVAISNSLTFLAKTIWSTVGNNWLYTYGWFLDLTGNNGELLAILGPMAMHLLPYWVLSFLFALVEQNRWLLNFKMQREEKAKRSDYWRCAKQVLYNQFIVAFPVLLVNNAIMHWLSGGSHTTLEAWPSFWKFLLDTVVFLVVEEVCFFYAHRLAHSRLFYKRVHKQHHDFQAPIAVGAIYCHPIEHVFVNLLPLHLGPLATQAHLAVACAWYFIASVNTVYAHCGYQFFLPNESHDLHHKLFRYNFGVLGILDYLHGTQAPVENHQVEGGGETQKEKLAAAAAAAVQSL